MSKILYTTEYGEVSYDLEYWKEYKKCNNLKELELLETTEDKDTNIRWCTLFGDFIDDSDCGKAECSKYIPQNGKRGKCVYKGYTYISTGRRVTI
ncbi:MAG: hypothetical protein QM497_09955 [Sulfurimonas sp.]